MVCKFKFQGCLEFKGDFGGRGRIGERSKRVVERAGHTVSSCGHQALFSADLCVAIGYLISFDGRILLLRKED